jgi:dynein heavy chain
MIWAAGGCLSEVDGVDYRKQFSNWWKNEMKTIKFPSKGTVFDYYVKDSRLDEWSSIVETIDYSSEIPMGEVTVPNTENVSMQTLMKALILVQQPVMLIGLAGCGKTQTCNGLLKNMDPEVFCSHAINFNFYTDFNLLQTMMDIPLEKKAGRLFAPPGKLKLIYFIDDMNMPALDQYNTQTAISLMRQVQEYKHWWDMTKIQLKDIGNTQYLACMNPTAGSFIINPRLQRWFWTLAVPFPEQSALGTVYSTFMKGHFERLPFKASVQEVVSSLIKSALSVHFAVVGNFRKTAANFHYEFNIRHLSGVFSGLLQASPKEFSEPEKLVALWLHESERIYGDRLVSVADLKRYKAISADMAKKDVREVQFWKVLPGEEPGNPGICALLQGTHRGSVLRPDQGHGLAARTPDRCAERLQRDERGDGLGVLRGRDEAYLARGAHHLQLKRSCPPRRRWRLRTAVAQPRRGVRRGMLAIHDCDLEHVRVERFEGRLASHVHEGRREG